jgi:hypothetical protein
VIILKEQECLALLKGSDIGEPMQLVETLAIFIPVGAFILLSSGCLVVRYCCRAATASTEDSTDDHPYLGGVVIQH